MKRLIGLLIVVSLIAVAGTAFAAELNVGSRLYTKFLDKNAFGSSNYATTGNGVGIRSELELTLAAKVSDRAEMGGRILTVWAPPGISPDYSDWWGWYDGSANLWQVRGMWLKCYPATIPTVKSVLLGSSDLGMFTPWTIGKIRWIDRDNARIILGEGEVQGAKYNVAMIPAPLFMAPDWGSAIWAATPGTAPDQRHGWVYGASLAGSPAKGLNLKLTGSRILALQQDPTTTDDTKSVKRFDNIVGTLDVLYTPNPVYSVSGLLGVSRYSVRRDLIGFDTWYPHLPYADLSNGTALQLRGLANDPMGIGLNLQGEIFTVTPDFVSIMAARRESSVLLSQGHVRYIDPVLGKQNGATWKGAVDYEPSAHAANDITDWNEANAQNIIGTSGITVIPEYRSGPLGVKGEISMTSNNLNSQNVDTAKYWWSAAKVDQSASLMAVRGDYLLPMGVGLFGKVKMVSSKDGADKTITTDNVAMDDQEVYAGASYQLTDEIGVLGGYKTLSYVTKVGGTKTYNFQGSMLFAEVKANVGGVDAGIACEMVDGKDKVASAKVSDMRLKGTVEIKI